MLRQNLDKRTARHTHAKHFQGAISTYKEKLGALLQPSPSDEEAQAKVTTRGAAAEEGKGEGKGEGKSEGKSEGKDDESEDEGGLDLMDSDDEAEAKVEVEVKTEVKVDESAATLAATSGVGADADGGGDVDGSARSAISAYVRKRPLFE
jgi:hypothetical protein